MLVMKAVEEARRALEVLQLVSMEDLDDLSEILTQIVDGLRVYVAALDLTVPDDVATGIFEKQFSITNFSREHRLAERLVRRVIRITFYRQSQGYSSPLAEAIAELDQAKIALANNWQSLADFAYLLEDENVARKTLGSLNTMLRSIGLFKQAYASARSIAEAWLAIGQHPQQQEPTSHQLSIRDGGGASTLAEAKRLLGFLEVVLTVAAAEVGEATLADSVTLERLETGSVDVILKAVPPQLWAKVHEMLARMTNRTGNRLGDLDSARVLVESVNESERAQRLTGEQAAMLRHQTFEAIGVLARMEGSTLEVDGVVMRSFSVGPLPGPSEVPALPAPQQPRRRGRRRRENPAE